MARAWSELRLTDETPPMELGREHPLWEYCVDEADVEGQHEGTVRPSEAMHWNSVFDHLEMHDLAIAFGEAELADGRVLRAEVRLDGAAMAGGGAGITRD